MKFGFCTVTSRSRLCQSIAMYNSLERNMDGFTLFVLCTDSDAYHVLKGLNLAKVKVFELDDVENSELLSIKSERTENEYCWTLKPVFLSYILDSFPDIDIVTHLDADLYFFSSPLAVFYEGKDYPVLLSMHLHPVNDDVNSGFVSFKRNLQGMQALAWWRKKCIGWCYFRKEDSRFGDQGYLDKMLEKYSGVHVVSTPGVNIAPWNSYRFTFEKRDSKVHVNGDPLIFYHFCGFRVLNAKEYGIIYTNENIPAVYDPYVKELGKTTRLVESQKPGFCSNLGDELSPDKILRRGAL